MNKQSTDRSQSGTASNGANTLGESVAGMGREAASAAKRHADTLLADVKSGAADAAHEISGAIDPLAGSLADSGQETLGRAVGALSNRLHRFAGYLEEISLNDLARDGQRMAQRNPGLFIAGGLALGFALSRFLKASAGSGPSRGASRTH